MTAENQQIVAAIVAELETAWNAADGDAFARFQVAAVRSIAPGVTLAHVKSVLNVPAGPLAGEHHALFSMVIAQSAAGWSIASFHNTLAT